MTIDIALTFTGIGNFTKLRYLTRLKKLQRIVLGTVEITSSTADILLRYTDLCEGNRDFCDAFQEYNTYLQLGLLGSGLVRAKFKASRDRAKAAYTAHRKTLVAKHGTDDIKIKELDGHFGINNAGGKVDKLFLAIKNHPDFQGFKTLCINNPKVSVKLAGDEWVKFTSEIKTKYVIRADRNLAKMEFEGQEFLIASGKKFNNQMVNSGKFLPKEFVDNVNKGQRVFTPSISTRHLDTESLGLEYFAKLKNAVKGGKYPKVTGKVKITSDLCPCPSCLAIFQQFSDMFPNVTIDITTTTKLHY